MKIASNFTRILSNENVSPNSKGLRALGWPVKGVGAVPQFFALVLPQHLWLMRSAWTFLRTVFYSRTQKDTSVENCCCCHSAFTARPPQASVLPSWGPFLALQNSSYFGRVHLGLPSFNFLRSDFFLFVRAALVIIKPNCSQNVAPKMGPPQSPNFGTCGGHFCGRSETRFNGIGGPKLGPPKTQIETQNWCQFLSPSFDTICLPRDAISKYINPACQVVISPQNQDQLRLIQHWWWKFQMLNGYPYNCILNYMAYRCDVR